MTATATRRSTWTAAILLLFVLTALAPVQASARTYVSRTGGTVKVRAGAGDQTVFMAGGFIKQPRGGIYARRGCENPWDSGWDWSDPSDDHPDRTMVRCGDASGWRWIKVRLGRGDDSWGTAWGYSHPRIRANGERGDDRISGYSYRDVLIGGRGRDRIYGEDGRDYINARDGQRDYVDGGDGRDTARVDRKDIVIGVERVRR